MYKYRAVDKSAFDAISRVLKTDCDIREVKDDYIQTYCGIHVKYLGHYVKQEGEYNEDGNEITPPVYSDYVLIDAIVPDGMDHYFAGLEQVFPQNPIHQFS